MNPSQHLDRNTRRFRASSHVQPPSPPIYVDSERRRIFQPAIVLVCLLVLGLVAIGVIVHARSVTAPANHSNQLTAALDPRLIMWPQSVTGSKRIDGLQLEMTTSPLIPGINHFTLRIDNGSQPIGQASVTATATMLGMIMRPLHFAFAVGAGGRYTAASTLPMFGHWQIALKVQQPHRGTVTTLFPLALDLPAGLFSSPQTKRK